MFKFIKQLSLGFLLVGGLLLTASACNATGALVVQFEKTPLFSEANFLPGNILTRWAKVTNNDTTSHKIAAETINETDPDHFASQLDLTIKEASTTLFSGTLADFFAVGEKILSDLPAGQTTQYDFTIAFKPGADNNYQGKTLGFDMIIGFQGGETSCPSCDGDGETHGSQLSGGGGGTVWVPGLTIAEETVVVIKVDETSATIYWTTSYKSTSQIIYAPEGGHHTLDLTDATGTPPKYGYDFTTPEYDVANKVTAHTVVVTGLTPGTTYYFRPVSHGSLAIAKEYTFTTLSVGSGQISNGQIQTGRQAGQGTGTAGGGPSGGPGQLGQGVGGTSSAALLGAESGTTSQAAQSLIEELGKNIQDEEANQFLGNIASFFINLNFWWWLLIIIIILFILWMLFLVWQRRKKEEEKKIK
ncbi:MAG: fibronectin type III domain-containing protein [Candidatus Pacebacteria bacterium]|nr:fibronectin type III domain-containing protein [Candidatus Paceibacterota bacterium]